MKIIHWLKECFIVIGMVIGAVAGAILAILLLLIIQPFFWLAIIAITLIIYML